MCLLRLLDQKILSYLHQLLVDVGAGLGWSGAEEDVGAFSFGVFPGMDVDVEFLGFAGSERFNPVEDGSVGFGGFRLFRGGAFFFFEGFGSDGELGDVDLATAAFGDVEGEALVVEENLLIESFGGNVSVGFEGEDEGVAEEVGLVGFEHTGGEADFFKALPVHGRCEAGREQDAFAKPAWISVPLKGFVILGGKGEG